ncbi:MAG: hypothetical protein ACLR56_00090 [Oscillospiraceae bacterium]
MADPYQIWKKNPKAWTWEKFWSMCEQFVNANKNKSGYSGATFEYGDSYVRAMGGYIINYNSSTGKFVNGSKLNSTISSWQTTLQMQEKGLLLENHSEQSFDQGKTLFFLSGPFSARAKDNRQSALRAETAWALYPCRPIPNIRSCTNTPPSAFPRAQRTQRSFLTICAMYLIKRATI